MAFIEINEKRSILNSIFLTDDFGESQALFHKKKSFVDVLI